MQKRSGFFGVFTGWECSANFEKRQRLDLNLLRVFKGEVEMDAAWEVVRGEFADLSLSEAARIGIRLGIAGFLGGLLGFERERRGKDAGIRTHVLVCMGTALFATIPSLAHWNDEAISRVLQGVITGIGFIGAGTIVKHNGEGRVEGLTTSAGIWFTCAVGIAAGLGKEASAILGAIFGLVILSLLPNVATKRKPGGTSRA